MVAAAAEFSLQFFRHSEVSCGQLEPRAEKLLVRGIAANSSLII